MGVSRDVFSFINAIPNAVLIVDVKRGKVIGANAAFSELMGFASDAFLGVQLFKLPFSTRKVKRWMLRMFVKVSRNEGYSKAYTFPHVSPGGTISNVMASARKVVFDYQEYVVYSLKQVQSEEDQLNNVDSWNFYMKLACEPYMEFRPVAPVPVIHDPDGRLEFLQMLGGTLRVKFSNGAAVKFYEDDKKPLEGRTFLSFFNRESDAIGFLDMLSAVGQIKGETAVDTCKTVGIRVEMDCVVRFDNEGDITALYCAQRDLSDQERYKTIIGGSRSEMGFMFNQPFVGFAFLVPVRPLERPQIANLDAILNAMLDQITMVRANEAMINIYGSDKTKFLMKPMRELFSDTETACQVLKELFVVRETSAGWHNEDGLELVSVFRAVFDNADRLSGVFVVTSKHSYGYRPRHTSKPREHEHVAKHSYGLLHHHHHTHDSAPNP